MHALRANRKLENGLVIWQSWSHCLDFALTKVGKGSNFKLKIEKKIIIVASLEVRSAATPNP